MTKTLPAPKSSPADLRVLAFTMSRALRALRSGRLERALDFLMAAQLLAESLPMCFERAQAVLLLEALANRGIDIETARLEAERATFSRRLRLVVSK